MAAKRNRHRENGKTIFGRPAKGPGGAPSKWTPELGKKLVELVRRGNFYNVSARCCGISAVTFGTWRDIGEEFIRQGKPKEELAKFFVAVTRAEAAAEADAIRVIEDAAKGIRSTRIKKTTRKTPIVDEAGNVTHLTAEETVVETETTQDWKAAHAFLTTRHPGRYKTVVKGKVEHDHRHVITDEDKISMERIAGRRMRMGLSAGGAVRDN